MPSNGMPLEEEEEEEDMRNFSVFCCSSSHCPSALCVSAANAVCKRTYIFRNQFKYKQL
jgi:hypothetical protein